VKNMKRMLLAGLLSALWNDHASAAVGYRQGCEFPMQNVEVCWELTGDEERQLTLPLPDLHLLPVSRSFLPGQPEILVDYTRWIHRQLLPSNMAARLHQEWTPVEALDQAIAMVRRAGWPAALWVSPRVLRDASPTSPGIVDLDVYLLERGDVQPLRTMRLRVTSQPEVRRATSEHATLMSGALLGTGVAQAVDNPLFAVGAVAGAMAMAPKSPPEPGRPLPMLTELAVRQVIHLSQFPFKEIPLPQPPQEKPLQLLNLNHDEAKPVPALPPASGVVPREESLIDRVIGAHR
jgi:hypothetical protein